MGQGIYYTGVEEPFPKSAQHNSFGLKPRMASVSVLETVLAPSQKVKWTSQDSLDSEWLLKRDLCPVDGNCKRLNDSPCL